MAAVAAAAVAAHSAPAMADQQATCQAQLSLQQGSGTVRCVGPIGDSFGLGDTGTIAFTPSKAWHGSCSAGIQGMPFTASVPGLSGPAALRGELSIGDATLAGSAVATTSRGFFNGTNETDELLSGRALRSPDSPCLTDAVALVFTIVPGRLPVQAAPAAAAPVPAACANHVMGTRRADVLRGTPATDLLRGGAGDDRLTALAGDDCLVGGSGRDVIDAGAGDDVIDAADHRRDVVRCGPGSDRVRADRADRLSGCEHVRYAPAHRG